MATLTNPASLTADSLNTFTAPAGTTLDASTTYWITVNEGISSNRAHFSYIGEDDETGETGWTIGDGRRSRTDEMGNWSFSTNSLMIEIKGTAIPPTTLVSNTHLSPTGHKVQLKLRASKQAPTRTATQSPQVDIRLRSLNSGSSTSVKIRENNDSNQPGDLVATLTNPTTLTADSLNTFTRRTHHAGCEHDLLDNRERGNLINLLYSSVWVFHGK